MQMPRFLGRLFGRGSATKEARRGSIHRHAKFDNAQTTDENKRHWREADELDATSQLTPDVRNRLGNRCQYEVQNNGYCAGMVRMLVNDTVGRGPRLQMETDDSKLNQAVESMWREWASAADWGMKCRVNAGVRFIRGEGFGVFRDSKRLARLGLPVTLDVRLMEPVQIADPLGSPYLASNYGDDGVVCDEDGEVIEYKVLKYHPGSYRIGADFSKADTIKADDMLHWYIPERPGQLRGYCPLTPSLGIFAQLRRFTMATLSAAEIAASFAGVMTQDGALGNATEEVKTEDAYTTIDIVRAMLMTLPPGADIKQFEAKHPSTQYEMFVNAKLRECGRALNIPFGKVAGDHSRYNYSSGRLDDAPYWSDREIERQAMEAKFFNPFFYRWIDFARLALPALAIYRGKPWELKHSWHYDARPTSDPVKDATGDELNLTNATDTLAGIAARDGTTVEAILNQRKREMEMFEERGLPAPAWLAGSPAPVREFEPEEKNSQQMEPANAA
jgi:lambda family phage portal protein